MPVCVAHSICMALLNNDAKCPSKRDLMCPCSTPANQMLGLLAMDDAEFDYCSHKQVDAAVQECPMT